MTAGVGDPLSSSAHHASTDVLVIGGGPAGSTAAILLAERGYKVVVVDKARHPRFHIGESLLPANLPLFERLGVADRIRAIGLQKWGAEFVSPSDGHTETFEFAEAWNKRLPYAYQVRRSEFDEILIRRAAERGATVIEGCRARTVEFDKCGSGVRVEAERDDGARCSWDARFLIDASGRDTFLANHLGVKRRNPKHSSAAIYGHFAGAERHKGRRAGNILIYWFDHGWFWFIPLADGATSVGAVVWPNYLKTRRAPLRDFLLASIQLCPPLAERLKNASLITAVEAAGNYSYASDCSHGRNYLLIGDAYAFIDPVFSSGVWLAMHGAVAAGDAVDTCLREPAHAHAALRTFHRVMRRGTKEFSWFIYRVTTPAMRQLFMQPGNPLRVKEALLSVLAGDIFGDTPIWPSVSAFKAIYYFFSAFKLRRTLASLRRHRQNITPVAPDETAAH